MLFSYTIYYYPPAGMQTLTVQAKEYIIDQDAYVFVDESGQYVLSVPQALNPVVTRGAAVTA